MIKNNKYLNILDVQNLKLSNFKKIVSNNRVNLFLNVNKNNIFKEYINFAKSFGSELKYGKKSYHKFTEISQAEIGLHTDGVSCLKYNKIPKLIFFYVKKWPSKSKGYFKVASIKKLLSIIPKKNLKILKEQKLQYLNYFNNSKKNLDNEVSFQKKCLRRVKNRWTLDMFLPLKKISKNLRWQYQMKFENLNLQQSKKILSDIRKLAENKECCIKFPLRNNSIMVFDNEQFFHGREKFNKPVKRTLYRVQILN